MLTNTVTVPGICGSVISAANCAPAARREDLRYADKYGYRAGNLRFSDIGRELRSGRSPGGFEVC